MDISALGAYYLNDARFAGTGASGALSLSGTGSGGKSFAGLLEKALGGSAVGDRAEIRDNVIGNGDNSGEDAIGDGSNAAASQAGGYSGPGGSASRKPVIDREGKLYEQCLSLETFLVKTLITGMRNTVQKSGLMDDSFAGKMYEDMLYDEYASTYTKNAKFGLADLAYLELTGQRGKVITR